ncbi:MAG: class 1 fructose-bisphosphatase [Candidatus Puniceispirillaceae bacterium]|jgi:fructose-1,6-bisphosphatase I|nr:class 1 fructose-bisphosphatase [Candidatus Puniceispirillum sp.]MBL6673666.1 class 1 fructose-bisphosphatase [Candidatus Puniceispirillum sp.]
MTALTLTKFLTQIAADQPAVAASVRALAGVAVELSATIARPDSTAQLGAVRGSANADGDDQKKLDVLADEMIATALAAVDHVAAYLSEERDAAIQLHDGGDVIVASDPLDGSSNIDTNVSIGTIFSILPASGGSLQPGRNQLASGIFVYGPQTTLLVTCGDGVFAFQLGTDGQFHDMGWQVRMPAETSEFAINASNSRHWAAPVSRYIADCLAGSAGPRQRNFNMRWVGSLVADGWRIFRRGGIFLYPADARDGYDNGRLRLVYEASPMAFLVTQAGGRASDGQQDILDIVPDALHQRVPLVFGSANEVDEFVKYGS